MKTNKEYTPLRRFYAIVGFVDVALAIVAVVGFAVYSIARYSFLIN